MKIKNRDMSWFFSLLKEDFISKQRTRNIITNIYFSYFGYERFLSAKSAPIFKFLVKSTNNSFYKSYINNIFVKNNIKINSCWRDFFIFQFKRYYKLSWLDNWELTKPFKELDFTNYQLFEGEEHYIKKYIKNEK
jgi:hypothetical protein